MVASKRNEIATRYSGVLLALAHESKISSEVIQEVGRLSQYLAHTRPEWAYVVRPTTSLKIQHQILEKLGVSLSLVELLTQFLKIVCQNRRLDHLIDILSEVQRPQDDHIEGIIEAPDLLSSDDLKRLQEALKAYTGKTVVFHQVVKESLLGGMVLRLGTLMIDASLQTKLHNLHNKIKG